MQVFMIAATSIDGLIACRAHQTSTDWTSKEDLAFFRARTKQAGVMIMGRKTFETLGKALPGRWTVVMTRDPVAAQQKFPELTPDQVWFTDLSPQKVIEKIAHKKYSEVAICGGSSIYSSFLKAGLIHKIYLTIEPIVFGQGTGLFDQLHEQKVSLIEVKLLSPQTVLLEYDVKKSGVSR